MTPKRSFSNQSSDADFSGEITIKPTISENSNSKLEQTIKKQKEDFNILFNEYNRLNAEYNEYKKYAENEIAELRKNNYELGLGMQELDEAHRDIKHLQEAIEERENRIEECEDEIQQHKSERYELEEELNK